MRTAMTVTAAAALIGGMAMTAAPASAQADNDLGEFAFSLTATQALVNTSGGITISGTMSCTAAIDAALNAAAQRAGTTNVAVIPNGTAGANPGYTVSENIGRTRTVSATYNSGIQQLCYQAPGAAAYPWKTLYGYPVGTQQWLYPTAGKFAPGSVHVEFNGETHVMIAAYNGSGGQIGTYTASLYSLSGVNLKVTMVKPH